MKNYLPLLRLLLNGIETLLVPVAPWRRIKHEFKSQRPDSSYSTLLCLVLGAG